MLRRFTSSRQELVSSVDRGCDGLGSEWIGTASTRLAKHAGSAPVVARLTLVNDHARHLLED